jgi:GNAT superfamily N-acetyltransferase
MKLTRNTFSSEDINEITTVLTKAFLDDPLYAYIMPDARKRTAQLAWWMNCLTRYGCWYGKVYTTPRPIKGAAIWLPPDTPMPTAIRMIIRTTLILAPLRLGFESFFRMLQVTNEWAELHEQEPARHWYLMVVGVDPENQSQGIGSSLLQPVPEKADREELTCYLETTTMRSVEFYERHKFEILGENKNGKYLYWTMRRVPQVKESINQI